MLKFKKLFSVLVGTATTATALMIMPFSTFAAEKTWQEAYLEAMENYQQNNKSFCECRLIYLNDDDIPEFYIGDPMEGWYGGLYSFLDGELIKLRNFGFRDFFSAYSEKSGIFRNDYYIERAGSKTGIKFFKMDSLSLIVLDELSYDVVNEIYEVNGKVVDKETYDNKISEYALVDVTSTYLSYDDMKKYLLDSLDESNNETKKGDANDDGKLTASDAAFVAKALAEASIDSERIKAEDYPAMDFNQDGKITAKDAADIARYLAEQSIT